MRNQFCVFLIAANRKIKNKIFSFFVWKWKCYFVIFDKFVSKNEIAFLLSSIFVRWVFCIEWISIEIQKIRANPDIFYLQKHKSSHIHFKTSKNVKISTFFCCCVPCHYWLWHAHIIHTHTHIRAYVQIFPFCLSKSFSLFRLKLKQKHRFWSRQHALNKKRRFFSFRIEICCCPCIFLV